MDYQALELSSTFQLLLHGTTYVHNVRHHITLHVIMYVQDFCTQVYTHTRKHTHTDTHKHHTFRLKMKFTMSKLCYHIGTHKHEHALHTHIYVHKHTHARTCTRTHIHTRTCTHLSPPNQPFPTLTTQIIFRKHTALANSSSSSLNTFFACWRYSVTTSSTSCFVAIKSIKMADEHPTHAPAITSASET